MRRLAVALWSALLVLLVVVFVVRERGEVFRIGHVLRTADLSWLLLGIALEGVIVLLFALKYRQLLQRLGHPVGVLFLAKAHLQRQVVATVVPVGGPPSMAVFVRTLRRRDVPDADALFVVLVVAMLGTISFALFVVPVLLGLALTHQLSWLLLAGSLALLALVAGMGIVLRLLMRAAGPPAALLHRLPSGIGRFAGQVRGHGLHGRDLLGPLGLALAVDLTGGLMLYACLRAAGQDASLITALVGYTVGTIFLLIAPVFQGLGVVEVSTALALERLGVPSAAALATAILYRFCELWLPLIAGIAIQPVTRQGVRRLPPHLPGLLTAITGFLTILSVLAPSLPRRFNRVSSYGPLTVADASRTFTLVAGVLLLALSYALWRRKRIAWLAAIVLLIVAIVTSLPKQHDEILGLVAIANLGVLLHYRRRFRVRSDLPTVRRGLVQFALSLLFTLGYGTLGFWLLDRRAFGRDFSVPNALARTLRLFFSLGDAGLVARTRYAAWFLDSFTVVGLLSLAAAVWSLLRPVIWRHRTLPAERERARRFIAEHGDSSLDFFKSWPDKLFFFSSTGDGVIAYGLALSTALALGDPVAANPAAFQRVLAEFLDFCDANGWRVAFHQVPAAHLPDYQASGFSRIKIGEDALVDLTRFSLQGPSMKSFRSTLNRLQREGYRTVYQEPPLDHATLARLRAVSDEWLQIPGRRERGFTLGDFNDAYVRSTPVIWVEDAAGKVLAFANVIPDGVAGEATLDLMRRRTEAPNGVMDFLFIRLFDQLRTAGYTRFSLGLAPLADVGTDPGSPVIERGLHLLAEHQTHFFSYKGLHDYKDKFGPIWEPRYLVFQSEATLPLVTLALIRLTEGTGGLASNSPNAYPDSTGIAPF